MFPAQAVLWLDLRVNAGAGISRFEDLKVKKVGVPDYVMTAALWFGIFLRESFIGTILAPGNPVTTRGRKIPSRSQVAPSQ